MFDLPDPMHYTTSTIMGVLFVAGAIVMVLAGIRSRNVPLTAVSVLALAVPSATFSYGFAAIEVNALISFAVWYFISAYILSRRGASA